MNKWIQQFLKLESASGILLLLVTALALVIANSPLSTWYDLLLEVPVEVRVGALFIGKPLVLWINDGLMAVFFFLVGLELKRELLEGELSSASAVILPAVGALGGMLVPAAIYLFFNSDNPVTAAGWAIPAATDIAFALGLLMLLGERVPTAMKIFLVSLAIFDDIGAILIIAFFYTSELSWTAISVATVCLLILTAMNRSRIDTLPPYIFVGLIMWVAVLKSGVHATLAGVALAFFIPLYSPRKLANDGKPFSPLRDLEHDLHGVVAFAILPLFAFVNAGIPLVNLGLDAILHPVPLGIAAGLVLGKPLGIVLCCGAVVLGGFVRLPPGITWSGLFGVSLLCGVGFTMSLFIGSLAFGEGDVQPLFDERLGVLTGSLISAILGYAWLAKTLPAKK